MKHIPLLILFNVLLALPGFSQDIKDKDKQEQKIYSLIENYTKARETKDTVLLKSILTTDIDQLVSSGEWRFGKQDAVNGMLRSSSTKPGTRTINIEKIRFPNAESAIVDAKYEIRNTDSSSRKMWSTFIVVYLDDGWKITAIRNMLPADQL